MKKQIIDNRELSVDQEEKRVNENYDVERRKTSGDVNLEILIRLSSHGKGHANCGE